MKERWVVDLMELFYALLYTQNPLDHIEYIVEDLIPNNMLNLTFERLITALDLGLKSGLRFTELYEGLSFPFSEETAREFAEALLRRLGSSKASES